MTATVLVIDDEIDLLLAVAMLLEGAGYRVLEASTASAGLELAEREMPDAVVLDMGLPDMEGLELLRRLNERPDKPRLIVLSAHASGHTARAAHEVGCDAYLFKPFDPDELLRTIETALDTPPQRS